MAEQLTALERKVAELTRRLDEQPAPVSTAQAEADIADLKAIVQQHWAYMSNLAVRGSTSRSLGHSHSIDLPVVKK